jgi:8-oxo-dGTP pyrophosphatase MutT (NUDIX family)
MNDTLDSTQAGQPLRGPEPQAGRQAPRFTSIIDVHVILRRAGRVLLLRRAGDVYGSGRLCLPSGHLERGESILAAAVRETFEETGIVLDPQELRHVVSVHQRNPGTADTRIGFAFTPQAWEGEPVNAEPHKHSGLAWAASAALPPDTAEYTAAVITAAEQGLTFTLNGWQQP